MKRTTLSVRATSLIILFILLLPITLVLGISSALQFRQVYSSNRNDQILQFQYAVQQQEDALAKPESFLANLLLQSALVRELNSNPDPLRQYLNKVELYDTFGSYLTQNSDLLLLAIYCKNTGAYLERDSGMSFLSTQERIILRQSIQKTYPALCDEEIVPTDKWFLFQFGGRNLLCRTVALQGTYCLCALDLGQIAQGVQSKISFDSQLVIQSDAEYLIPPQDMNLTADLNHMDDMDSVVINPGNLLAIRAEFLDLNIYALTPNNTMLQRGWLSSALLTLLTLLMVFAIPCIFYLWRRRVILPLDTLKATMNDIRAGNLQSRAVNEEAGTELKEINQTFNQMMEDIRQLKIDTYEKELMVRQTQLQYYRLQIRPHFYLNCFKNFYALTAKGDIPRLEKSILLLSNYLRHTFQQHEGAVPLEEEITQCHNYINLFGLSASYPPILLSEAAPAVLNFPVPTVSILTLVENALKHTPSGQRTVHISLAVHQLHLEDSDFIHIQVKDDGPGFPEEMVHMLNTMDWDEDTGHHIGLKNIIQRLRLMYGQDTHIMFYNENGAVVELFIPANNCHFEEGGTA